jgi:hypothetical protein
VLSRTTCIIGVTGIGTTCRVVHDTLGAPGQPRVAQEQGGVGGLGGLLGGLGGASAAGGLGGLLGNLGGSGGRGGLNALLGVASLPGHPLVQNRSPKIAHSTHVNEARVTLGLNEVFAASDRVWSKATASIPRL